jgi:hypothetical protein
MSDIAGLAYLAPVLGDAPWDADYAGPDHPRPAKARADVWDLIEGTPTGFPGLVIAGKVLAGWLPSRAGHTCGASPMPPPLPRQPTPTFCISTLITPTPPT